MNKESKITTIEFWNLLANSMATILAGVAILLYIILWKESKANNDYNVYDSEYMEILKAGMNHPTFRNPKLTNDYTVSFGDTEKIRYETYALMSFKFCETIFDKNDTEFMDTWDHIINIEYELHGKWLQHPDNSRKFEKSFITYMNNTYPLKTTN